ncbi:MAG: helix-turn-helix transcriptional regulator [Lachnospiraceae bacterium]|nr:helix-turn-helix transcriptional regulator [Lachnospiraceae bacterium]
MGTINERIRILRKSEKLNQDGKMTAEKFAQRLGIGRSAISLIETGVNNVSPQLFNSICREFNVNPEWLRSGTGPMFKEPSENERITEFINRILTDEPDGVKVRFISAVSKFTDRDWETVLKVARELLDEQTEEEKRRQQLHEELDRQLDLELNPAEESSASSPGSSAENE